MYCGVVGDNVVCNSKALRSIEEHYPILAVGGCIVHCFDLRCEDIANISEVAEMVMAGNLRLCCTQSKVQFTCI